MSDIHPHDSVTHSDDGNDSVQSEQRPIIDLKQKLESAQKVVVESAAQNMESLCLLELNGIERFRGSQKTFRHLNLQDFMGGYDEEGKSEDSEDDENEEDTSRYDSATKALCVEQTRLRQKLLTEGDLLRQLYSINEHSGGEVTASSAEELAELLAAETRRAVREVLEGDTMKSFKDAEESAPVAVTARVALREIVDEMSIQSSALPVFEAASGDYDRLRSLKRRDPGEAECVAFDNWIDALKNSVPDSVDKISIL